MSLRCDTSSLIAGALICGNRGLGVLGSEVPSGGDSGPGYLYNDLSLPADANEEVRGLIVTPPSAGTFFAYEDSSFTLTGAPDGDYSFVYELFVDGVSQGTATASIMIGAGAGTGDSAVGDFSSAGAGSPVDVGSGADTIGDFASVGQGAAGSSPITGAGADQVGDFASSGAGTPVETGSGEPIVGDFGSSGRGAPVVQGAGDSSIGEVASEGSDANEPPANQAPAIVLKVVGRPIRRVSRGFQHMFPERVRPGAVLDFAIDWKSPPPGQRRGYLLDGETISNVVWTLPPGLTALDAPRGTVLGGGTIAQIGNVAGFVDGQDYALVCEIAYGGGNKDSRVLMIECRA